MPVPPDDPRNDAAQSILRAARQASRLTRRLNGVTGRRLSRVFPLDLNAIISAWLPDLRLRVNGAVQIRTFLARKLPPIQADRIHLLEVLTQLVENAGAAMPHGGTLRLVTDVVNVGPQMQRVRPWLRSGRFVRLEVADSGPGIDQLDLCDAYGLVKQNGGFIWAQSEAGQGTRITVLLPSAASKSDSELVREPRSRVLLVEDDDSVCRSTSDELHDDLPSAAFLPKPFSARALVDRIEQLLSA